MKLVCPNCCNEEGLEIEIEEATIYKVILEPQRENGRLVYTLKERGKSEREAVPEIFCPACGETCEVPKEFWPPHNKVEYA